MAYIGRQQDGFGVRSRFIFTATGGQTTFTTDDSSNPLSYSDGAYVDVYLNGVLLDPSDYTATSLTSIVLDSGASASDILEVIVYDVFSVFSGTFTNGITANTATVTGDLTVDTNTLYVDSTNNNVGIGTSSPSVDLHVVAGAAGDSVCKLVDNGGFGFNFIPRVGGSGADNQIRTGSGESISIATSNTERMRIDSSGNVGIGTSSPANQLHIHADAGGEGLLIKSDGNTSNAILISANRSGASAVINQLKGQWNGNDVTDIRFYTGVDTANKDDGAIMFLTSESGGNPEQRMYIRADGGVGVGTSGASSVRLYVIEGSNRYTNYNYATNSAYTNSVLVTQCGRANSSGYNFYEAFAQSDREFQFRGDGNAFADGTFSGGGADYAEMFEWDDGNSSNEDRRGYSVVLTNGNKIRKATSDDAAADIIGVVSANPTVLGDSAWNMWDKKYNKDDFGNYILETYTVTEWTEPAVTNDDGEVTQEAVEHSYETDKIPSDLTVPSDAVVSSVDADGNTLERRQLNSSYDDTQTYTSREERQEWDAVGMMGKLRMRSGQPTGDRWIKMRDITSDIEEWLVR